MKKLKQLSAVLLSAAMLMMAVACGGTPSSGAAASSGSTSQPGSSGSTASVDPADSPYKVTEPITIEWWHALESQYHDLVAQVAEEFNKSQEFITVEPVYQGSYSDVNEKLIAAAAAGADALPAVTVANTPYVAEYGASGLCEDLTPYIAAENFDIGDFGEGLIASCSYEGSPISLPFLISTQILYYNKDMAEAEGIEMPETWADMQAFLEKATTADRKATAVAAWDHWYFEPFYLNAGVEIITGENTTDLGGETAMGIAHQFKDWSDAGYLDWCFGTDSSTNMRQGFFDGKYFSVMHTSSLYNMYVENCDFEVGMWYYPGNVTQKSEVGGCVLLIPAKNDQATKNAGWELLKFLTSKDVNMTWAVETGYMPTRNSVLTTQEGLDFVKEKPAFQVIYDNLDNINPRIQHPGLNNLARYWREAMAKAILEGGDLDADMAQAVKDIDEALDDAL